MSDSHRIRNLLLVLVLAAASIACATPDMPQTSGDLIDGSGVERYWVIQDRLMLGESVDESAWEALFATPAYQWQAGTPAVQGRIRERMQLAFQPDRGPLEAKVAAAEGYEAIRWKRHARIRDERQAFGEYYDSLEASNVIDEALAIAQQYLPPGMVDPARWTTPVRVLFFGPDAFAIEDAVVLDLIEAYDRGERLKLLLAHEFHHEYYSRMNTLPDLDEGHEHRWVLQALEQLHMEGLADRIDKGGYPLPERPGGLPGYVDDYNRHYENAPETLTQFDAALERIPGADDRGEAAQKAWKLLHFAGHVEGFFMANTVAEAQGEDALLIDLGDPFAFLRRFQSVRPTFSASTMSYLERVESELRH